LTAEVHGFATSADAIDAMVDRVDAAVSPIVFGAPVIGEDEIAEVVSTLRSGWIGTGPKTISFEQAFAEYIGAEYALATNSGTAALHLALLGLGVGAGDEVITTPLTFVATANVIEHCGARPVFCDVRPEDGNIDPAQLSRLITPRTKAIMPVHYLGALVDVDAIGAVAGGLPIVLDSAHAVEGRHKDGRRSAAGARCAAYSFYATKNVVTGEGGMLVTDDPALAEFARTQSLHGLDNDAFSRYAAEGYRQYDMALPGFKYNMTDVHASIGLHQLRRVEANLVRRAELWTRYNDAFVDLPGVEVPPVALDQRDMRHSMHIYSLWLDFEQLGLSRRDAVLRMRALGVGTGWHFRAVHLHRYYRETYGYWEGSFPVAEAISRRSLSIPLSAGVTDDEADRVIAAVRSLVRHPAPRAVTG
jgi:dTDP-4-amino-4,6-dideoxygalactose transaminase